LIVCNTVLTDVFLLFRAGGRDGMPVNNALIDGADVQYHHCVRFHRLAWSVWFSSVPSTERCHIQVRKCPQNSTFLALTLCYFLYMLNSIMMRVKEWVLCYTP